MIEAHSPGGFQLRRRGTAALSDFFIAGPGINLVLPFSIGTMSRPSITRSLGTSMPANVAMVGYQSIARVSARETVPPLTPRPGPHAMAGTRMPAS